MNCKRLSYTLGSPATTSSAPVCNLRCTQSTYDLRYEKKTSDAINRLKNARELRTNPVLQLNLANALLQGGQPGEAATILNRYTFTYKEDGNGWDLLAQAEGALGNRDQELAARAESMALVGQLEQAISLLSSASSQVKLGSLQQARYDARIDQLRDLQARFRPYQKM